MSGRNLDTYKYFISCYFHLSYGWDDIEMCIDNLLEDDSIEVAEKLLAEAKLIKEMDDWDSLRKLNIETGYIYYDKARNKEFIQILMDTITEKLINTNHLG